MLESRLYNAAYWSEKEHGMGVTHVHSSSCNLIRALHSLLGHNEPSIPQKSGNSSVLFKSSHKKVKPVTIFLSSLSLGCVSMSSWQGGYLYALLLLFFSS